ncbi:Pgd1 [Kluyveromyces lactis]|nr:Pgd1 [Kluyveromyces lactis]
MAVGPPDQIFKENLTFDTFRELIIEKESTADEVADKVLEAKKALLPIRTLMTEFVGMIANLESMGNKTSQEKFLAIRMKLIELQNNIQKFSKDFQQLQPVMRTMDKFNEEVNAGEKKFFVQETLGYTQPASNGSAAGITKTSSVNDGNPTGSTANTMATAKGLKKNAAGKPNTGASVQSGPGRRNSTKKTIPTGPSTAPIGSNSAASAAAAANTPSLKQIPNTQPMQLMPGVSPMAMASPLNNISPQRKLTQHVNQSRENSLHQGATPSASMITPQNILNMSAFDLNQNQTPQSLDNVNNMDLTNLDLDSLNMEFLN